MTKVYTKSGDAGTTSLIGGERVSKSDLRVEAYGTVDELTAFVALLADKMRDRGVEFDYYSQSLDRVNSLLMTLEAHLAASQEYQSQLPPIEEGSISWLEEEIDRMQGELPSITLFTIPGGCKLNSLSHICRTICRRAERRVVALAQSVDLNPNVMTYLNRLSDYLYLLGRTLTMLSGAEEMVWG